MRINIYTEELLPEISHNNPLPMCELVSTEYISSHSGEKMTNWGIRFYLKSHPDIHASKKDDDRSAVTFWCGADKLGVTRLLNTALRIVYDTMENQ